MSPVIQEKKLSKLIETFEFPPITERRQTMPEKSLGPIIKRNSYKIIEQTPNSASTSIQNFSNCQSQTDMMKSKNLEHSGLQKSVLTVDLSRDDISSTQSNVEIKLSKPIPPVRRKKLRNVSKLQDNISMTSGSTTFSESSLGDDSSRRLSSSTSSMSNISFQSNISESKSLPIHPRIVNGGKFI